MEEQTTKKIRLGAFVLIATLCLILGLYFIGSKRNIFNSNINVSTQFSDINGLIPGNNVQFNGINVGNVSKVEAISDTAIRVVFTIQKNMTEFITQNAIASIGTDGLLGNKLVSIKPAKKGGLPVTEGFVMKSANPINTDLALKKLLVTNDNLSLISESLKLVSLKFNAPGSPISLLTDTGISQNFKTAMLHIKQATNNTEIITADIGKVIKDVKSGKGSIGKLINDTLISIKINKIMSNFLSASDSFVIVSSNLKRISEKLNNQNNTMGKLLNDTVFARNLDKSMENLKNGSESFNKDMKAVQYSWPFKKGIRKLK